MPKIHSPFERKEVNGDYVVTPNISDGMEWVFESEATWVEEKIHGTNVSILIENGGVTGVWNRKNRIRIFEKGNKYLIQGILNSIDKGWVDRLPDGQHFGELVGPKVNGNPYELDEHVWFPFAKAKSQLRYKSWGEYPKTFEAIEDWFKNGLIPLFYSKMHGCSFEEANKRDAFVEGLMFKHPSGKRAKLRYDMYSWFEGERH